MKNSIIALLMGVATLGQAQITLKTPPPSPEAEWTQKVGFTSITVAYERPLMRGRKVFGALVPFDQLWRTGAGESTKIKFSEDIEFAGQQVKKGTYSLFSIPNANDWTIILILIRLVMELLAMMRKRIFYELKQNPKTLLVLMRHSPSN